jgi:EmrB/QacA subfamily drug resistance transporter
VSVTLKQRDRFGLVLIIVGISAFMVVMDNTVVIIVKETIERQLHVPKPTLEWTVTGYILIFSCLMIPGGRLVDVYGQRTVFTVGMGMFTGASLLAGFSPDIALLIVARLIQGAGAALALPATVVMINLGRTDKQKSTGMIVWIVLSSAAAAIGPSLGALINSLWGWQGIFFVNVPIGIFVVLLGLTILDDRHEQAAARIDLPGVLITATMLFAATYALTEGAGKSGWTDPAVLGVFGLAVIALVSLALVESWAPDPIFDTSFFQSRVFVGAVVSLTLIGLGFNGVMYYGTTFMKDVLGFSDVQRALVLLPAALILGAMTPVAFWLAQRFGPRLTIGTGMVLMAIGMCLFATLHHGDGPLALMPGVILLGVGSGLGMPLTMYVLKGVPEERSGVASGILNVSREMSGGLGIAVLGAFILSVMNNAKSHGIAEGEAFRRGTVIGLPVGAVIVLLGGVVAATTLPRREPPPPEPEPGTPAPEQPAVSPLVRKLWGEYGPLGPPPPWPPRRPEPEPGESGEFEIPYDPYDPAPPATQVSGRSR